MAPSPAPRRVLILIGLALSVALATAWWRPPQRSSAPAGCGPTSLYALCRRFGLAVTPAQVFALFAGNDRLASFAEMEAAARQLGFRARGREMNLDELKSERPRGILHLDGSHFVDLLDYESSGLRIADPIERGRFRIESWSYADLALRWDGRILIISRASLKTL